LRRRAGYRGPGCGLSSAAVPKLCPDYRRIVLILIFHNYSYWAWPVKQACRPLPPRTLYTRDLPHSPIWKSVVYKTDDDRADALANNASEPGNRARRGLSHLRSLSGNPDDSDPLTRRASFLEKVDIVIVACWEGQNPRLQAKASAFLATRQGGIEGVRPYDLGACSIRLSLVQ
jgi:hypothetical protein